MIFKHLVTRLYPFNNNKPFIYVMKNFKNYFAAFQCDSYKQPYKFSRFKKKYYYLVKI